MLVYKSLLELLTLGCSLISVVLASPAVKADCKCTKSTTKTITSTCFSPTVTRSATTTITKTASASMVKVTATTTGTSDVTSTQQTTFGTTVTTITTTTSFTSTETDTSTVTSTETDTVATPFISPSPTYSHDEDPSYPNDVGDKLKARNPVSSQKTSSSSCTTVTKTCTSKVTEPTTVTCTKSVTAIASPRATTVTTTVGQTVTDTVPTLVGPTTTETDTSTSTIFAVTTTSTVVTTTTTTTVTVPSPTYSLAWDMDTCGYSFPHIVDIPESGAEEDVVVACANVCTADPTCQLWEAYYTDGSPRCATFASEYDPSRLDCPDQYGDGIGYSIGAQKVSP